MNGEEKRRSLGLTAGNAGWYSRAKGYRGVEVDGE